MDFRVKKDVDTMDRIDVAVGLIMQNDQVLIAWRDSSLHQGNRYEFSGGKVELGETPLHALQRELNEELNIQVTDARKVLQLTYDYPEKRVCLHVFKVSAFTGTPKGQQGQLLKWVKAEDLFHYQFPDANLPILRVAQLPELYPITTQDGLLDLETLNKIVPDAFLYLRTSFLNENDLKTYLTALYQSRPDLKLILPLKWRGASQLWYQTMTEQGASPLALLRFIQGFQWSHQDLLQSHSQAQTITRAHAQELWFGSCHDVESLACASALSVDAVTLSPVLTTKSHLDVQPLTWLGFEKLVQAVHLPVYALGGLSPLDLVNAQKLGAFGVSGISNFKNVYLKHEKGDKICKITDNL